MSELLQKQSMIMHSVVLDPWLWRCVFSPSTGSISPLSAVEKKVAVACSGSPPHTHCAAKSLKEAREPPHSGIPAKDTYAEPTDSSPSALHGLAASRRPAMEMRRRLLGLSRHLPVTKPEPCALSKLVRDYLAANLARVENTGFA